MKFTKSIREEDVKRDWILIDAKDKVFGRVITEIATKLRGKHKPYYTPHVDCGDYVVVINADKVILTGKRELQKTYFHHTQYPGGVKTETFAEVMQKHPERVIENAVKGMLPKNRLGRKLIKKLKVYAGENHPHAAQQPKTLSL